MPSENPTGPESASTRISLLKDVAILQVKLLVDGIRDALLIPLSLVAALIGMVRGGPKADEEFRRVIKLGRRTERWINLFGHQSPLRRNHPVGSLDGLLDRVEEVVMDQYRKGQSEAEARAAIRKALQENEPGDKQSNDEQPNDKRSNDKHSG